MPRAALLCALLFHSQRVKAFDIDLVVFPKSERAALEEGSNQWSHIGRKLETEAIRARHGDFRDQCAPGRDWRGVGFDDGAFAFPLDDGHRDGVRVGAVKGHFCFADEGPEKPVVDAEPHDVVIFVQRNQRREGMRVEVRAVPRVETVVDDVSGVAGGLELQGRGDASLGTSRDDGAVGGGFRVEVDPGQKAIVMKGVVSPQALSFWSQSQAMPGANQLAVFDFAV